MKKKFLALSCIAMASMLTFGACGGGTDSSVGGTSDSSNSSGAGSSNKTIVAPKSDLAGFDASYLPLSTTERKSGKIDVALVFEDTLKGWEALAAEYERLHGDAVAVELNNTSVDASAYQERLSYEIQDKNSDWDIVQGNLFQGDALQTYCMNMYSAVNDENTYAGAIDGETRYWSEVLERDAYITDKSGSNERTFIMNSEGLQTAWFVNTVAVNAAKGAGYTGSDTPANWDEMIDLCKYMELAGYNNPLGIALDKDSISASQFTWLLRVYGDYYYRNDYDNIMLSNNFVYDPADINPEANMEYGISASKFYYSIFAYQDASYYVGPGSAKYQEFIEQFQKMRPYLRSSAADSQQSGLAVLRTKFATQSEGKNSPQIFLDYAGAGLKFQASETADFKVDFFDYPAMISEGNFIPNDTALRDVGGNGGYLSILKHNAEQDALNLDFIKFVVSPYGQSIYYDALNKAGAVPMGMTTVVNDYVVIPEAWKTFFATEKITFNGLVDSNPYISNLIRGFQDEKETSDLSVSGWKKYLTTETYDTATFMGDWADAMDKDWITYCATYGKDVNLRNNREGNESL